MSSRHGWRRVRAGVALAALAGGPALPLFSLADRDETAAACCGRGRCCCGGAARLPQGPCLRALCGCAEHAPSEEAAPLLTEAVLSVQAMPTLPHLAGPAPANAPPAALARPGRPPTPPPRLLLSAGRRARAV